MMGGRCFLADLVPLRAGRPLRSPGPGEGSEGAAEAGSAASVQTVSGTRSGGPTDLSSMSSGGSGVGV